MGLDTHELIKVLNERRQKVVGRNKLVVWWCEIDFPLNPCGGVETFGVEPACCFWYSKEGELELPDCAVAGLRSLLHIGKLQPRLCAYQEFTNVPEGVLVVNAEELLSFEKFESLVTKCENRIALLADYVRVCDMERNESNVVWFWDVDTLVLHDLRNIPVPSGAFGHLISTMDRRPGCMGG